MKMPTALRSRRRRRELIDGALPVAFGVVAAAGVGLAIAQTV